MEKVITIGVTWEDRVKLYGVKSYVVKSYVVTLPKELSSGDLTYYEDKFKEFEQAQGKFEDLKALFDEFISGRYKELLPQDLISDLEDHNVFMRNSNPGSPVPPSSEDQKFCSDQIKEINRQILDGLNRYSCR